ncbi:MAG: CPBP family glutamic-type intramembrane protease [Solirubrobacterales bacterium]
MNPHSGQAGPGGAAEEPAHEGVFNRSVAIVIDNTVWFFAVVLLLGNLPTALTEDATFAIVSFFVVVSLWFNYFTFCEWRWGKTLGKHVMGMKVVSTDGGEIGFGPASIRGLLRLVDFWLIGEIMIASSERKQRLGDKLADTVVIRTRGEHPVAAPAPPIPATEAKQEARARRREGLPWVTWNARQAVLGMLVGLLLAAIVAPLLVIPFDTDLSSLGATLAAQALLTVALLGTAFYIARGEGDVDLRAAAPRLGLRRFKPSALALALGTLFAYFVAVAIYVAIFGEPHQDDVGADLGLDQGPFAAAGAIFLIALVAPLAEESFFRGFFFAGLRTRLPKIAAAVVSGLVFGAVHAPEGPSTVVPLALLGIALALLYERTGSLWPCVFAHCVNNSLALAIAT